MLPIFRHAALGAALLLGVGLASAQQKELVILHTNDTHSQIEPNPTTASRNPGEGGIVRRAAYFEQVRKAEPNVIVVDAGDFVQGSPYYNFFGGEVEIKMMNKMGYDVGTLGNHEFDNGLEPLAKILAMAEFPIICANYDCCGTPLEPYIKPTAIVERGGVKVGFVGICVKPDGLISKKNFGDIKYLDPVESLNKYAAQLKQQGCDLVVCVSHIGFFKDREDQGDRQLAANSTDVDIIIGGHTHTNLKGCEEQANRNGKAVRIVQNYKSGFCVGRINVDLK
jgi:5'-nucleotidase